MTTAEPVLTIHARRDWGPQTITITVPQEELRQRLKDGESLTDIVDDLIYNTEYCELESDPYDYTTVVEGVDGVAPATK